MPVTRTTERPRALLALWVAVAIWASTFVVSQDALAQVGPGFLTAARFAVASMILVPGALRRGANWRFLLGRQAQVCGLTGVAL